MGVIGAETAEEGGVSFQSLKPSFSGADSHAVRVRNFEVGRVPTLDKAGGLSVIFNSMGG